MDNNNDDKTPGRYCQPEYKLPSQPTLEQLQDTINKIAGAIAEDVNGQDAAVLFGVFVGLLNVSSHCMKPIVRKIDKTGLLLQVLDDLEEKTNLARLMVCSVRLPNKELDSLMAKLAGGSLVSIETVKELAGDSPEFQEALAAFKEVLTNHDLDSPEVDAASKAFGEAMTRILEASQSKPEPIDSIPTGKDFDELLTKLFAKNN